MKKNILAIMGLACVIMIISSCSGYDEDFLNLPPEQPTQQPTDDNKHDDTWEETKDDWFEMPTVNLVLSYKKTNKKDSYMVEVPFSASLGTDQYFSFDKKSNGVVFKSLENFISVPSSYGEWYSNNEGDSIRAITTNQNFDTNIYTRTLSITTGEAKRMLNGKPASFLMPTLSFSSVGTSLLDSIRLERNDSIIDRFTYRDSVVIKFVDKGTIRKDLKPYTVTSKTTIEYFVEKKEKNETMPTPDITVGEAIVSISDRTASPIYAGNTITWNEVSLDKTTDKVYVIVNGQKKDVWNNSDLASVDWCNSAVYDTVLGRWVPCHLAMDPNGSGWSYTFQLADGTARKLDAPMNAALISSLKSFQEDDNAKQSPFLNNAAAVKRTFTDGVIYSVNGKYPYTVGYKF